jgi:hypothetical protein
MVTVAFGAGFSFVSITTAALGAVEDAAAGIASGLLSTTVQIGGAIGVAVLAGVVATHRAGALLAAGSTPVAARRWASTIGSACGAMRKLSLPFDSVSSWSRLERPLASAWMERLRSGLSPTGVPYGVGCTSRSR